MSTVLYITANPKSAQTSFSLAAGEAFIEKYQAANPSDEVVVLDLFKSNIPYIDEDVFSGWGKLAQGVAFNDLSEAEQSKVSRLGELNEQFIKADKYVFVTPFWNFSYPPVMKAYLDAVSVANKSFKYTAEGVPVGLLTDKKAIHIQARGGYYSQEPMASLELGNRHIEVMMNFFGVPSFETLVVEGHNKDVDRASEIKAAALIAAANAAEKF